MAAKDIKAESFKTEVLDQKGVVFVDFHAEWCGPCKMTGPIIDAMSNLPTYEGKVKFVKVDVDANNELAAEYNVFSIPTFVTFKDGVVVNQFAGARDQAGFESELNKFL